MKVWNDNRRRVWNGNEHAFPLKVVSATPTAVLGEQLSQRIEGNGTRIISTESFVSHVQRYDIHPILWAFFFKWSFTFWVRARATSSLLYAHYIAEKANELLAMKTVKFAEQRGWLSFFVCVSLFFVWAFSLVLIKQKTNEPVDHHRVPHVLIHFRDLVPSQWNKLVKHAGKSALLASCNWSSGHSGRFFF